MAKNSIRDFSATAGSNTDIQSVNIDESCPASGINNAIRELMADLKDVSTGAVNLETPAADSLTVAGDLTVDTNTLKVDSSNNRVAIGTTSTSAGQVTIQGSGNPRQLVITDDGAEKLQIFQIGNDATIEAGSGGSDSTNLIFKTASSGTESEAMRITSGGNVGIGTASAFSPGAVNSLLSVAGNLSVIKNEGALTNIDVFNNSGSASARGQLRVGYDASNCLEIFRVGNSADIKYNTTQGGDLHFQISGSTKTRINGNGTIISENVGSSSANLEINGASTNGHYNILMNGNSNNGYKIAFKHGSSVVGSIITTNSNTSYNTSSDHRLKENVADMTGAIDRVKALAPKRFNFIADTTDRLVDGFLAHEAQTVVPEAVTGSHNETEAIGDVTDADGNNVQTGVIQPAELEEGHSWTETGTQPVMQGIDQSKLVPLLTGALQEAIAKIETLETEMTALKARVTALEA